MKTRAFRRLRMESLEERRCLAASAMVTGGNLIIASNVAADLLATQTGPNTWEVTDGGSPVGAGTFNGVSGNVTIQTSSADDLIEVDLNGFTAPRSLLVRSGPGTNDIHIHGGEVAAALDVVSGPGDDSLRVDGVTIGGLTNIISGKGDDLIDITDSTLAGHVRIYTGIGNDATTFGDGGLPVVFGRSVLVRDNGDPLDSLTVNDGVTIAGSLQTYVVNDVELAEGSVINGSMCFIGGFNVANSLAARGIIDGSLMFYGSGNVDSLTMAPTSSLGGSLTAFLRGAGDTVDLAGDITGSVFIDAYFGDDTIELGGFIAGRARVLLGAGNDYLNVTGQIGVAPSTAAGRLQIDGGAGNDQIALRDGAEINGQVTANLAGGNDEFGLEELAVIVSAALNGGSGADTYYGDTARPNVNRTQFESVVDSYPPF